MTHAVLRLDGDRLAIRSPEAGLADERPLGAGWRRALRPLGRRLPPRPPLRDRADALLTLGRAMYAWLDGGEGWLARLRRDARPPLLLEVEVSAAEGAALAFLEAPWELLADAVGHLAARPDLAFSPVRRLGRRVDPSLRRTIASGSSSWPRRPRA